MDKHKVSEAFSGILKQYLDTRQSELEDKFTEVEPVQKNLPKPTQTYSRNRESRDYMIKTTRSRKTDNDLLPYRPLVKSLSNALFSSNSLTTESKKIPKVTKVPTSTKSALHIYGKKKP